jgi:hypothetical protein
LYTCGEAYSDQQGWVNGALRSAELVLTGGFGLQPLIADPADWINGQYPSSNSAPSHCRPAA